MKKTQHSEADEGIVCRHYFGAAYYPEHRDPARWEFDLDLMAGAGVNALRVGEFAWGRMEPQDGEFDFDWLDRFQALAAERGIGLLLCPPIRTLPAWLATEHPELSIVREDGVALEYGSRYSFCINQPLLRERGRSLAEAMAAHFGAKATTLGWHLDNEHGDEPDCHCPVCRAKFQAWLEAKYGTVAALNEAWGTVFWGLEYGAFTQIPTPRVSKTYHNPSFILDWRRFRSECTIGLAAMQADAIRPTLRADQFITTNHQTLWNGRTDYYAMARHLDRAGTNYYPPFGEKGTFGIGDGLGLAQCRSYQNGRAFQIHELRCGPHLVPGRGLDNTPAPGEVARLAMHGIAHGAEGLFFFRWRACPFGAEQAHGTVTDYDGRPTRVYPEVARVGAWWKAHAAELAATRVEARVAVLTDFQTRWTFEALGPEWGSPGGFYNALVVRAYGALRRRGYVVDATSRWADWSRYKMLVVPALLAYDDAAADRLAAYVRGGGSLVVQPLVGWKDEHGRVFPDRIHPRLRDLLGVTLGDFATFGGSERAEFSAGGALMRGEWLAEFPEFGAGAEVMARFTGNGWWSGRPAVVRVRNEAKTGAGTCWCLDTFPERDALGELLATAADEAGIAPILPEPLLADVEAMERRAGDGTRYIFLQSAADEPRSVAVPDSHDIFADVPVAESVTLPPHGVAVLKCRTA